jgi:hypothetical protein
LREEGVRARDWRSGVAGGERGGCLGEGVGARCWGSVWVCARLSDFCLSDSEVGMQKSDNVGSVNAWA